MVTTEISGQSFNQATRGRSVGVEVAMFDFFAYDPCRHRVDVKSLNVATNPICFQKRRSASHEWVGDRLARKIVALKIALVEPFVAKLGEEKAPKERTWTPRKPLMNRDDRSIVLLDLLFLESKGRDQRDVKAAFNGHDAVYLVWEGQTTTFSETNNEHSILFHYRATVAMPLSRQDPFVACQIPAFKCVWCNEQLRHPR